MQAIKATLYNQNLSLQRTENVKKYLVKKGIHPRILTQYHGNYGATKEELARRVELSLLSESSFSHHIFKIDIRYSLNPQLI
jgi:hypothetical protein